MYVGVILEVIFSVISPNSIPHVCGGDPIALSMTGATIRYSPCMWG